MSLRVTQLLLGLSLLLNCFVLAGFVYRTWVEPPPFAQGPRPPPPPRGGPLEMLAQDVKLDDGHRAALKDLFDRYAEERRQRVHEIQKIREAERDSLYDEFFGLQSELITGTVQRFEGGAVTVNLGKTDGLLPRPEQIPGDDLPNRVSASSDDVVTQVIAVGNVNAAQLVPVLRPLMPQNAQLSAVTGANMLIISDRASNVNRMMRIVARIDQSGGSDIDVIPLQSATAADTTDYGTVQAGPTCVRFLR